MDEGLAAVVDGAVAEVVVGETALGELAVPAGMHGRQVIPGDGPLAEGAVFAVAGGDANLGLGGRGVLAHEQRQAAHQEAGFGGALKNVSIGIASSNGKRWIHSAGVTKDKWVETPQDAFLESMAEADEAVISHMHGKMMYLNVMNRLSVDCDCLPSPTEPDMHDIGVLSSLDPVALDQACVDLIHTAPDGASVTERIASLHGEHILEYAEELGIGSRAYRLTVLD